MRPTWCCCIEVSAPLMPERRFSARKTIEVSGVRRSCATSMTRSRPLGPPLCSPKLAAASRSIISRRGGSPLRLRRRFPTHTQVVLLDQSIERCPIDVREPRRTGKIPTRAMHQVPEVNALELCVELLLGAVVIRVQDLGREGISDRCEAVGLVAEGNIFGHDLLRRVGKHGDVLDGILKLADIPAPWPGAKEVDALA